VGEARAPGARRAATALTQRPIGELRSDPSWRRRLEDAVVETCRVALPTVSSSRPRRSGRSSTRCRRTDLVHARDIAAGRPSELDAITRAAVRAAHRLGVPAPGPRSPRGNGSRVPSAIALISRALRLGARQGQKHPPLAGHPLLALRDRDRAPGRIFDVSSAPPTAQDRGGWRSATRGHPVPASVRAATSRRPTSSGSRTRSNSSGSTTTSSRSSGDQSIPWPRRVATRPAATIGDAGSRLDPRVEAREATPGKMWVVRTS